MTKGSEWEVTKDENGNDVYTWKDYEVRKLYAKQVIAASYIDRNQPPTYGWVGSWKAFNSGQPMDTDPTLATPDQLKEHCEQHDGTLD